MGTKPRGSGSGPPTVESALRHLGTRDHGILFDLLKHAIERPQSRSGTILAPLTDSTASLTGWTVEERAAALWRVIRQGVQDPDVSPTPLSRRRRALQAALRLPDADIHEPWGSSLTERFKQLMVLKAVFRDPTTTQPMEMAWTRGVRGLADHLEARFRELRTPEDWQQYRPESAVRGRTDDDDTDTAFRQPSRGAQPVFVNLFVTTVFMKGKAVYRRITERLITARADGVAYYTARGFAGKEPRLRYVPVQALWGCEAEFIESPQVGRPAVTRLWFPAPLQAGEQAHFASEVVDENITEERRWIDVDVDHHGIARGRLMYGDRLPVSGLTIRVRFEDGCLPEAVWWYAELNESERYDRPPSGDRRLLSITGNDAQFTFTEQACQPREHYGLAFWWKPAEE